LALALALVHVSILALVVVVVVVSFLLVHACIVAEMRSLILIFEYTD
jgi:hypothetical protein